MKKLINLSIFYFIFALFGGVFFREFTKAHDFKEYTELSVVHTHLFVLGMLFFLVVALFVYKIEILKSLAPFKAFIIIYNVGLIFMVSMLFVRGILQVLKTSLTTSQDAIISGIAGISHILLAIGLIFFFISLKKALNKK